MPWEAPPQTYLSGNTAGTTHVFGPIVTLQGSNITLSGSGNKIVLIGPAGATQTIAGSAAISAGTQSVSTGTVKFADSNGVTFGMSGSSQITATVKTDYLTTARASTDAIGLNTAQTAVTWTVNSSGLSIDAGAYLTTARRSTDAVGLNTAKTAVTWTVNSSGISFDAGAYLTTARASTDAIGLNTAKSNVTWTVNSSGLSLDARGYAGTGTGATNAGLTVDSGGVSVSLAAQSAVAGHVLGVSNTGNTAGNTGTGSTGTVVFAASGGLTASQSTGAGISTVWYSVGPYITTARASTDAIGLNTAQTNVTWTANSSGLSLNAGGYAGTVSGATNCSVTVNTSGVSVNVPNPLISRLVAYPAGQMTSSQQTNATISFVYLPVLNPITFSRLDLPVLISLASSATANTGNLVITSGAAIYSRNGSTLNPIVGQTASTTYTWASNTANFNSISGARPLSFALATSLSVGEYWVGVQLSTTNNSSIGTATTQLANTISVLLGSVYTASGFADFGALTNGSTDIVPGFGACSVTMSNTTQTYQFSQITATGAQAARANLYVVLRNF